MKAAYKSGRQKGIQIVDLPVPTLQKDEVLVHVKAAAVCGTDLHLYNWNNWCENVNAKNPIIIGHEFCGKVIEVGKKVTSIKKGDLVAGETHIPCGECFLCRTGKQHICMDMKIVGVHTDGAFAEYVKVPEVCTWKLPEDTPPEVGAIYEPFGIAVHGVLKGEIGGCTVAIMGCGPIGLFSVGVASSCGASRIFVADINDYRLGIAKKIDDQVITLNPLDVDIYEAIMESTAGLGADVLIELSGSPEATKKGFSSLRKGGRVSLIGLHPEEVCLDLVNNVIYKEATIYGITGRLMFETWYAAEKLLQTGRVNVHPVITHTFGLEDTEKAILLAMEGECGKPIIIPGS